MLPAFSFSEPICMHVPFEINKIGMKCENGDRILSEYFYAGIIE